jgi:cobalt-zinc-cadmium resistance protein CzcA
MLNGVELVSSIQQLRHTDRPPREAVITGARRRLRPVLMTALATSFGFIPMALPTSTGCRGSEATGQRRSEGSSVQPCLLSFLLPVPYAWTCPRVKAAEERGDSEQRVN